MSSTSSTRLSSGLTSDMNIWPLQNKISLICDHVIGTLRIDTRCSNSGRDFFHFWGKFLTQSEASTKRFTFGTCLHWWFKADQLTILHQFSSVQLYGQDQPKIDAEPNSITIYCVLKYIYFSKWQFNLLEDQFRFNFDSLIIGLNSRWLVNRGPYIG